jgi:pimeloyl-ACP methyl ester carboxylesterase
MPVVQVNDGLSMHYEDRGSGDPIVWIAGTGQTGAVWHRFQLPAFTDRYRCVTMDLRGSGQTDAPCDGYDMPNMAYDVEDLIRTLDLGPSHVVGLSMGSAIVQELALAAPRLVRSAVMCGTWSCSRIEHHLRRHFEFRLIQLAEAPMEVFRAGSFWAWAPSFMDDEASRMAELEEFVKEVGSISVRAWMKQWRADVAHDTLGRLPKIGSGSV